MRRVECNSLLNLATKARSGEESSQRAIDVESAPAEPALIRFRWINIPRPRAIPRYLHLNDDFFFFNVIKPD